MTVGSCSADGCKKNSVINLNGKGYCKQCYLKIVDGEKPCQNPPPVHQN